MYSIDYKRRAVEYKHEGHTFKELREAFKIPPETYYIWAERLGSGYYDTKVTAIRSRKIDRQKLIQAIKSKPDAYLRELAEPFGCSPQAVFYMLEKLHITLKKRPLHILKNPKNNAMSI